jgi:hypothetical protein
MKYQIYMNTRRKYRVVADIVQRGHSEITATIELQKHKNYRFFVYSFITFINLQILENSE